MTYRYAILIVLPFVVMVITLWLMGRPWWCGCGSRALWGIGEKHYSQHLFDRWTPSHFYHGGFFYAAARGFMLDKPWQLALFLAVCAGAVWEIIENTPYVIKAYRKCGDRWYQGDTILNSVGDLLACLVGASVLAAIV